MTNHGWDETKIVSSDIFVSSTKRCKETINFLQLNLPNFAVTLKHQSVSPNCQASTVRKKSCWTWGGTKYCKSIVIIYSLGSTSHAR